MLKLQIIETAIVVLIYVVLRVVTNRSVDRFVSNNRASKTRGKIVKKAIHLTVITILAFIIFTIFTY